MMTNLLDSEESILCIPNNSDLDDKWIRISNNWYRKHHFKPTIWITREPSHYLPDFKKYRMKWLIKPLPPELAAELVMARLEGRIK